MSTNATTSQTPDSALQESASQAPSPTTPATENAPVVRKRRSTRRPHQSKTRKLSPEERDRRLKRRLELKVLFIAAPTLLIIVGGVLWVMSNINSDASMRPKGLIRLSYYMLGIGLTVGIVALFADWAQKVLKIRKEKRGKAAEKAAEKAAGKTVVRRRSSSHRRHRSR